MSQVLSHTMDYIRRVQNIVFTRLPLNDIGLVTTLVIMDLTMMVKQEAKAMLEFNIDAEVDRLTHNIILMISSWVCHRGRMPSLSGSSLG